MQDSISLNGASIREQYCQYYKKRIGLTSVLGYIFSGSNHLWWLHKIKFWKHFYNFSPDTTCSFHRYHSCFSLYYTPINDTLVYTALSLFSVAFMYQFPSPFWTVSEITIIRMLVLFPKHKTENRKLSDTKSTKQGMKKKTRKQICSLPFMKVTITTVYLEFCCLFSVLVFFLCVVAPVLQGLLKIQENPL